MSELVLLMALTAQELTDLRVILQCGTAEVPTRICCRAAEQAKRTADKETLEVLNGYLRRNCWGPKR